MLSTSLLLAAILIFVVANIQYSALVVTIRQHYPDYYERVGSPPAFMLTPLNVGSAWSFLTYVIFAEYKDDDPPQDLRGSLRSTRMTFLIAFLLLTLAIATSLL